MKNIKIFVSCRIDLDSEIIDNPLYVPVRCGAIFDKRGNISILGDDTGDNISDKRDCFCELTVQYWAWKNVEADYYGLCHYRRYLSFSDSVDVEKDSFEHYQEKTFSKATVEKYGLTENLMNVVIPKFDAIAAVPCDFSSHKSLKSICVLESIKRNPATFHFGTVCLFIEIAKKKYPALDIYIENYFHGKVWRGFNCYIMKKEIFLDYNEKLFDILFEVEKKLISHS